MPHIKAELTSRKAVLSNAESSKRFDEQVDLEEGTVKTQKYSWGTMKTVHHNFDFSIPLHPEHHKEIAKLKDQQEHKFKTEDGKHWTAKRSGDDVHFQSANNGQKTTVKHSTMSEEVEQIYESFKELTSSKHGSFSVNSKVTSPKEGFHKGQHVGMDTLVHKGTIQHKDNSKPSKFEIHNHVNRGLIFQTHHSDEEKQAIKQHLVKNKMAGKATEIYKEEVEAQFDLIESVVEELALLHNLDSEYIWEKFEQFSDEELLEYAVDAKGHKSSTGGLTQKGRDAYNSKGANLQAPVTTPPSKLKAGSKAANRRKSFCARMGGMEGSMKKPNGEPSRKALALRKWNC